jgi:hypothetical protein
MDRPLLLLSWVHELMLQRQTAGGLRMPAPILARVYTVRTQPFCMLWGVGWPVFVSEYGAGVLLLLLL